MEPLQLLTFGGTGFEWFFTKRRGVYIARRVAFSSHLNWKLWRIDGYLWSCWTLECNYQEKCELICHQVLHAQDKCEKIYAYRPHMCFTQVKSWRNFCDWSEKRLFVWNKSDLEGIDFTYIIVLHIRDEYYKSAAINLYRILLLNNIDNREQLNTWYIQCHYRLEVSMLKNDSVQLDLVLSLSMCIIPIVYVIFFKEEKRWLLSPSGRCHDDYNAGTHVVVSATKDTKQ